MLWHWLLMALLIVVLVPLWILANTCMDLFVLWLGASAWEVGSRQAQRHRERVERIAAHSRDPKRTLLRPARSYATHGLLRPVVNNQSASDNLLRPSDKADQ